ncbi:RNA polymerase sigma factor [Polyangium mundeleinium]|uniref:Sigma-70 family RNA polymerase sigma factor n=1 Tax=Polyangium mundeleinium TaxID=2995306 RepID=A0ABT5EW79_9BACT|nr:sigma-70 family RNA polymerase sigma factor [Polyangium mundeleinium]MDC0746057.1 sigma-70 family RNA polymerase sigma factor [Polyangium mundeleinium]
MKRATGELPPLPDDPREALKVLAPRVLQWLRVLPVPWAPVPYRRRADVAQDILRSALESLPRYDRSKGSVATWLYEIARRVSRDALVQDQYRGGFIADDDVLQTAGEGNQEEEFALHERIRIVREVLTEMEPRLREVLEAREFATLTVREVGELVGVPERTAKEWIAQAREDFRERVEKKLGKDRSVAMLAPLLTIDTLFAHLRDRGQSVSAEELGLLHAALQEAPASGVRSSRSAWWELAGSSLGGGVVGGVIMYLLLRPDLRARPWLDARPLAERIGVVAAAVPRPMDVPDPEPAPWADTPLPASTQRTKPVLVDARAILEEAFRAALARNVPAAQDALRRYDQRFPQNPHPELKARVVEVMSSLKVQSHSAQ